MSRLGKPSFINLIITHGSKILTGAEIVLRFMASVREREWVAVGEEERSQLKI